MASLVANAAAAIQTIMGLAEKVPLVGNIAEGILYVKEVADTAEHNKKNCAKIAKRCDALAVAVESCAQKYAANDSVPGEKLCQDARTLFARLGGAMRYGASRLDSLPMLTI